jgi:hypothetical protein
VDGIDDDDVDDGIPGFHDGEPAGGDGLQFNSSADATVAPGRPAVIIAEPPGAGWCVGVVGYEL